MRNRRSARLQRRCPTWRSTVFCGWDWGSTHHGVCVIDDHGAVVGRRLIEHTESALARLFIELGELTAAATLPIVIERGEGLIVGAIAGAGHPVWMVEPAAFKAARPRWGSTGAKSDLGDAFMLADYARTDCYRLRRVEPVEQATRELGAVGAGPPLARRSTHRGVESAVGDPRRALAWRWCRVPEADLPGRPGLLERLPDAAVSCVGNVADGDPAFVVGDVVDPVGDRLGELAELAVGEVVDLDPFRFAFG